MYNFVGINCEIYLNTTDYITWCYRMLTFLSFYLCSGSASPQSPWSCYCSGSVWETLTVGWSAPRSSSADSGLFGWMKSAEFQTVCIFGQNFHNCRSRVEVVAEAERKTAEPASASLCRNVVSSFPTEIKYETEKINNIQKHQHQQILVD